MSQRPFTRFTRRIAIDFDGCLCENKWPRIGEPNWPVIREAIALREAGACLILWTNREGELLDEAVEACREWGLDFDAVNENPPFFRALYENDTRKIGADEYWDDRAVFVAAPGTRYRTVHGARVEILGHERMRRFANEGLPGAANREDAGDLRPMLTAAADIITRLLDEVETAGSGAGAPREE